VGLGGGVPSARLADHGLWRFGEIWVALAEGPAFEDYESGSGQADYQALQRLADRLRERREPTTG
jgi:hypothetical protein